MSRPILSKVQSYGSSDTVTSSVTSPGFSFPPVSPSSIEPPDSPEPVPSPVSVSSGLVVTVS